MPSYTVKTGHERLERVENSWETNAPDVAEFGGVKLTDIQAARKASDTQKDKIALAEAELKRLKIEYKDMMKADMEMCDFVVDAVVGDRRFGPDCALYAGFGYIRESEKKKGGGRRSSPTPQ